MNICRRRSWRRKKMGTDFFQCLPEDLLLNQIFSRLDFIGRVRAGGVCRAWRHLSHLPRPTPWVCANNFRRWSQYEVSPATAASPYISVVQLRKPTLDVVGSHGQYLIANHAVPDGGSLIYNPFTGDSFPLPTTTLFYPKKPKTPHLRPSFPLRLAAMSSSPATPDGGCVVAAINSESYICACRPGVDSHWVTSWKLHLNQVTDLFFHGGNLCTTIDHSFFASTRLDKLFREGNRVIGFDSTMQFFEHVMKIKLPYYTHSSYMVCSSGELLRVIIVEDHRSICSSIQVYRVEEEDDDDDEEEAVPVTDLGHRMLFVGRGCSFSRSGEESPDSSEDGFFTKNCVYYVSSRCDCANREVCMKCDIYSTTCARDKVRAQSLWKLSVADNQVLGPFSVPDSIGSLNWIIPPHLGND